MNKIITQGFGFHLISVSLVGLTINAYMFQNLLHFPKSSFYILCCSKTVSNCLSLLLYLSYSGPTNFFYTQIGSCTLNSYLNQSQYGLMLLGSLRTSQSQSDLKFIGPITQCLIAINRFLVVWFFPTSSLGYSNHVTVAAITVSWVFTAWFSTLLGLPKKCRVSFIFPHVPCLDKSDCNDQMILYFVFSLFALAVTTNFLNILFAAKLFCMSKLQKALSSDAQKSRRRLFIRIFLQSCFQDWIYVLDFINNFFASQYCSEDLCLTVITMGVDVLIYTADGLVMFIFNRNVTLKSTDATVGGSNKGKTTNSIKPGITIISP